MMPYGGMYKYLASPEPEPLGPRDCLGCGRSVDVPIEAVTYFRPRYVECLPPAPTLDRDGKVAQ